MADRASFLSTIPTAALAAARDQRVVKIGVAAGPAFAARREDRFAPALPIAEAVRRLEGYRSSMRVGRIELEDGTAWIFNYDGYRNTAARTL